MSIPDREPVTVELTSVRRSRRGVLGAIVSVLLGLAALIAAVTGTYDNDDTARIGAYLFGATMLVLGALVLVAMGLGGSAGLVRRFVFDADGMAQTGGRRPWRVAWPELSRVGLHITRRGLIVASYAVRIELEPVDEGFAAAHPELRRFLARRSRRTPKHYVIGLGPRRDLVTPIDLGLDVYAGERYAGPVEEGRRPAKGEGQTGTA